MPARNPPGGLAFPATTQLSEENLELVLGYMRGGCRGYDFVEIRFRECMANPPLGSFAVARVAKVAPAQSPMMKKEQGDQAKGTAGGGFKGPTGLDYSS